MKIKVTIGLYVILAFCLFFILWKQGFIAAVLATSNGLSCNAPTGDLQTFYWTCTGTLTQKWEYYVWFCPDQNTSDNPGWCDANTDKNKYPKGGQSIAWEQNPKDVPSSFTKTYGIPQNGTCGCVQADVGTPEGGTGTAGGNLHCAASKCCTNTCASSGSGPGIVLQNPANNTLFNTPQPYTVNFNWAASGGACGGNNCNGNVCQTDSFINYTIYVQGTNNNYFTSQGMGSQTNYSLSLNRGIYQWWVSATGSCSGSRNSTANSFTIDQLPGLGGNITSNGLCTVNGTTYPASAGFTGILPLTAQASGQGGGINNPLQVTINYQDPDGADDVDYMGIWVSRNNAAATPPVDTKTANAGRGMLHNNAGNYALAPYASGEAGFALGSGEAVCTIAGKNQQETTNNGKNCRIDNLRADAVAYAYPRTVSKAGNTISVAWDVGLVSPAKFDGTLAVYGYMRDKQNRPTAWTLLGNWKADLTRPASVSTLTVKSPTTFTVNYSTADPNLLPGTNLKKCKATQIGVNPPIKITRTAPAPAGGNVSFNVAGDQFTPCIDNDNGLISYQTNTTPFNSNVDFTYSSTDKACNTGTSAPAGLLLINPWLMTTNGDTYSAQGYTPNPLIQIPAIKDPAIDEGVGTTSPRFLTAENGQTPYLSTYGYLDNAGINIPRSSANGFTVLGYKDDNGQPKASSNFTNWYDFLESRVNENIPAARVKNLPFGSYVSKNISTILGIPANGPVGATVDLRVVVAKVSGDLSLQDITCDAKTIFLISGNLTLNPEFNLTEPTSGAQAIKTVPGNINGCLFIVKNKTTVTAGGKKIPPATDQAAYDLVKAFIITDSFESSTDADNNGLQVRGGVITNKNNTFKRDIGIVLNQTAPSEILRYDGGRYIYVFGKILTDTIDFNVREVPFTETAK
jgi:hypothetical protein